MQLSEVHRHSAITAKRGADDIEPHKYEQAINLNTVRSRRSAFVSINLVWLSALGFPSPIHVCACGVLYLYFVVNALLLNWNSPLPFCSNYFQFYNPRLCEHTIQRPSFFLTTFVKLTITPRWSLRVTAAAHWRVITCMTRCPEQKASCLYWFCAIVLGSRWTGVEWEVAKVNQILQLRGFK